jgi:hypothetical protein
VAHALRRDVAATLSAVALAAAPVAAVTTAPPASAGCPDGETGVIYGCSPFCLPGLVLDTQTGLCVKVPPPAAAPPPPAPPFLN